MRPTAVIMRDPHFGHRHPFTGEPSGNSGEFVSWDYALLSAYQVIEDNILDNGLLRWVAESDRVEVEAIPVVDKFQAAVDRKTSGKNYKSKPGERFVPRVKLLGGEMPTWREYLELASGDAGTMDG